MQLTPDSHVLRDRALGASVRLACVACVAARPWFSTTADPRSAPGNRHRPGKKGHHRLAEYLVAIADDHVTGAGNVDVFGVRA